MSPAAFFQFFSLAAISVLAVLVAVGAWFDYRERRIPNALNHGALAFALVLALAAGAPPLYYALVLVAFAFAFALYSAGAWAGGDTKFFTAALALAGLARFPSQPLDVFAAVVGVFLLGAALTAPFALWTKRRRAWREKRVLFGAFAASVKDALAGACFSGVIYCVGFLVLGWPLAASAVASSIASGAAVFFVASFVLRAAFFAGGLLKERIPLEKIRAGAIPAQTLFLDERGALHAWGWRDSLRSAFASGKHFSFSPPDGARVLCDSRRARGLSAVEAGELKRVFKSRGVDFLLVRDSLPFAPQVGVAALVFALARFAVLV